MSFVCIPIHYSKINLDKSKVKYIVSLTDDDYFPHGLSWIKTPLETLGISIVNNSDMNYNLNFQQRIVTLKSTLNIWKQRKLSIKRKITILNTLALAPLIYVSSVIKTPIKAIQEINIAIQNFIWDGVTTKSSQRTLIQNINNGGLKLYHFETKIKSLQLSWVKRLTTSFNHKWKVVPRKYFACIKPTSTPITKY